MVRAKKNPRKTDPQKNGPWKHGMLEILFNS